MTIEYSCRMEDPFGRHIKTFSNFVDPTDGGGAGLDYVLNVGKESSFLITVPATEDLEIFQNDCRFRPYRSIHGRSSYNDNEACYLLRKKTITDSWFRFSARHVNGILGRRIVAYDSDSAFAQKTDNVGDLIKQFARENLGSSIDASRDTSASSANLVTPGYLTIEADKGDGTSITRQTARGDMLGVCQDIADDSTTGGTYMSFGIIGGLGGSAFNLVTRAGQWGIDKRAGQPGQVILSPERGNIENWRVEIDYTEEATVIIAGGYGASNTRIIQTALDTTRINDSPFGHIEKFIDAPNCPTAATVLSYAQSALRQYGPKITFEADLIETAGTTRGIHFDLGDIITARVKVQGQPLQFDCRVDTIYVSVHAGEHKSRVQLTSPI